MPVTNDAHSAPLAAVPLTACHDPLAAVISVPDTVICPASVGVLLAKPAMRATRQHVNLKSRRSFMMFSLDMSAMLLSAEWTVRLRRTKTRIEPIHADKGKRRQ